MATLNQLIETLLNHVVEHPEDGAKEVWGSNYCINGTVTYTQVRLQDAEGKGSWETVVELT